MYAQELRTSKEETRYGFALAFSILAWIAVVLSIFGLIYAIFIIPAVLIGHALYLADIRHNGVKVGPEQMPELWKRVNAAAKKLGLETTPDAYVIQAGGLLNAFATRLFSRKFIILYSELLDACESSTPSLDASDKGPTELDFVIAHELGHIALGHLNWVLLPSRIIPLLGPAYSRACEYSCDICGDAVVGDPEVSKRALAILASGGRMARRLNLTAFAYQRMTAGNFWAAVYELNMSHPFLCKRVAALSERHQQGGANAIGRNGFAYPLAPAFSIFTGGAVGTSMLIAVMIVFVMGAAAIPAYRNYLEKAKAAQSGLATPDATLGLMSGNEVQNDANSQTAQPAPTARPTVPADGFMVGEIFPWRIKIPNESWLPLPRNQAKRNNPQADGWLVRADVDAHIMVIAEPVGEGRALKEFVPTVIDNAKQSATAYQLLEQKPMSVPDGEGVVIHSTGTISGFHMEFLTAVCLKNGHLFQIVAFVDTKSFASIRPQFESAIESFEVTKPEAAPAQ